MTGWRLTNQEVAVAEFHLGLSGTKAQACIALWIMVCWVYVLVALRIDTPWLFQFRMLLDSLLQRLYSCLPADHRSLYWDWVYAKDPQTAISRFQWLRNNGDPAYAGVGLRIWLAQHWLAIHWACDSRGSGHHETWKWNQSLLPTKLPLEMASPMRPRGLSGAKCQPSTALGIEIHLMHLLPQSQGGRVNSVADT